MIEARLADGRVLRFPDGTDPTIIQAKVKEMLSPEPIAPIAPTGQSEPTEEDFERADRFRRKGRDIRAKMEPDTRRTEIEKLIEGPKAVADAGLTMLTGVPGTIIGGLTGLGSMAVSGLEKFTGVEPGTIGGAGGLDTASERQQAVQETLTKDPSTKGGEALLGQVAAPFTKLKEIAQEYITDPIAEAGFPNVAAGTLTAIEAAPLALGAKSTPKPATVSSKLAELAKSSKDKVVKTMNQAVAPAFKKKGTPKAIETYDNQALTAVERMVKDKNKGNLRFRDEGGTEISRLPESLDDLQKGIDQSKTTLLKKYEKALDEADSFKGPAAERKRIGKDGETITVRDKRAIPKTSRAYKIDGDDIAIELEFLKTNKALRTGAPKTLKYADDVAKRFTQEGTYTAAEAAETIQVFKGKVDDFLDSPSKTTKDAYGKAMVNALAVNHLRKGIDKAIKKAKGENLSQLKKEFEALSAIEEDVARAANIARNKAGGKILPDFTDVIAGHQIVKGLVAFDAASIAGGSFIKSLSVARKAMKDPNRKVKSMFKTVEGNMRKAQELGGK